MLTPHHYSLGELITRLREEPDPSRRLSMGFRNPHSYRGFYEQLAFEVAENVTVGEMLTIAEPALGATYQGWKGGDYTMRDYTDVAGTQSRHQRARYAGRDAACADARQPRRGGLTRGRQDGLSGLRLVHLGHP